MFRFKTWMNVWDLVIISKWNFYVRAIWKVISEYYYDENTPIEYKHFRKVEWLLKDVNIPVERISNKNFSQQSIYNLKDDTYKQTSLKLDEIKKLIWVSSSTEKRNYVLIIDEINRWNISKIFWELITLIEPNKRLWWKEQIKVKLPYSQKEFWVPNNLYIIWTMNTADRSIALIDLALRRRFTFREIEPNSQLLGWINIEWINVASMFDTMNRRIEFLYDRDHLLWHAYFLPLKSEPTLDKLNNIMLDKIIPLLQEYFHDDWEKIQLVLWKWLIHSEMVSASDILWTDNTDYEDQPKYSINLNPSVEDYNI
jgi:5-methylcytosine-specific restriction endonuclease McrBC GTP-binding regulatory subunit McrB